MYEFLIGTLLSLAVARCAYLLVYRLSRSPLAKFPGPKLCAITRLPFAFYTWNGKIASWTHELHLKYGDVVRVAPDELSYSSADAWRDIYSNKSMVRDPRFYGETDNGVQEILRGDNINHARFRRGFTHAFSERSIKAQEPLVGQHVDHIVKKLAAIDDQSIDLVSLFNLATFDIMSDLTFGESLGLLHNSKYHYWVETTSSVIKALNVTRFTRWYPWASFLAIAFIPRGLLQQMSDNFKQCSERVDKRLAAKTSRPDIWGLIMSQPGERQFSVPEMYANSQTLMLAGGETSATLLSGLFYHLLRNPEKLQKLTEELRNTFSKGEEITLTALPHLKYLQACIEEGMRLFPPVPVGLPRVVPEGGATICGEVVPGKTIVSVSGLAAPLSPRNFKNPNSFIPERWMKNSQYEGDIKAASQPFSVGQRNCIGKNLAYHEMRVIAAKMLWNFDFELSKQSQDWDSNLKVWGVWEKPPLNVKVNQRR